jgi:hypothetical protein
MAQLPAEAMHADQICRPPLSLLTNGYVGVHYLGLNQPGYEANNSPSSNALIKNWWSCTSTPKSLWRIEGLQHSKKSVSVTAFETECTPH